MIPVFVLIGIKGQLSPHFPRTLASKSTLTSAPLNNVVSVFMCSPTGIRSFLSDAERALVILSFRGFKKDQSCNHCAIPELISLTVIAMIHISLFSCEILSSFSSISGMENRIADKLYLQRPLLIASTAEPFRLAWIFEYVSVRNR